MIGDHSDLPRSCFKQHREWMHFGRSFQSLQSYYAPPQKQWGTPHPFLYSINCNLHQWSVHVSCMLSVRSKYLSQPPLAAVICTHTIPGQSGHTSVLCSLEGSGWRTSLFDFPVVLTKTNNFSQSSGPSNSQRDMYFGSARAWISEISCREFRSLQPSTEVYNPSFVMCLNSPVGSCLS